MKEVVQAQPKQGLTVYDEEKGSWIEIPAEQQRLAGYVHQQALMGVFISAMAIKKMFDERLYLGLGCQNREEYIETMLPISRSQAYKYNTIATKFEAANKLLTGSEEPIAFDNGVVQLTGLTEEEQNRVGKIGIEKLYELSTIEDAKFAELIKNGKVTSENGSIEITDIIEASAREAQKKISEFKKKSSDKINQLSEEVKLTKDEKRALLKKNQELEEKVGELRADEMIYGPAARTQKEKQEHLDASRKLLNEFNLCAVRANIQITDPAGIKTDLKDLLRKVEETHALLLAHYTEVAGEE